MPRPVSLLACLLLVAAAAGAQGKMPKDASPAFEVVTVKPTPPGVRNQGINTDGSHIRLTRQTVLSMIMFSYGIHSKQVVDAPDWVGSQAWDVDGVPDIKGEPDLTQLQHLIQQLLADRFGLHLQPDRRTLNYYGLHVLPGELKLTRSTTPADALPDQSGNGGARGMTMHFTNNTLDQFTLGMQYFSDRPIVNETALAGRFDGTLQWSPDSMKTPADDAYPVLFTALREQMGLDLKPSHGPVTVMAVTAVHQPGDN